MIDVSILPDTHVHVQGCTGQIAATRREGNAGDRLAVVAKHGALAQGVSTLEDANEAIVGASGDQREHGRPENIKEINKYLQYLT